MDYCTPQAGRRHNPVDSICRKLQTIQWRGDREPNSPFQIPKLSSSSYNSPQCGLRHNLEAILKKSALQRDEGERGKDRAKEEKRRAIGMPSSAASKRSTTGPSVPPSAPCTPACNPPTPANVTYTITSTLGERRGGEGSDLRQAKTWQRYCSTPTGQSKESPYFTFTQGPQSAQPEAETPCRSPPLSRTFTPNHSTLSYNLNFFSADTANLTECELPYPALVVKRLSMGDGGRESAVRSMGGLEEWTVKSWLFTDVGMNSLTTGLRCRDFSLSRALCSITSYSPTQTVLMISVKVLSRSDFIHVLKTYYD